MIRSLTIAQDEEFAQWARLVYCPEPGLEEQDLLDLIDQLLEIRNLINRFVRLHEPSRFTVGLQYSEAENELIIPITNSLDVMFNIIGREGIA